MSSIAITHLLLVFPSAPVGALACGAGRAAARPFAVHRQGELVNRREVEDVLCAAAELDGLVADDGQRQCWATIRSGMDSGPQQPVDLDAEDRPPAQKRRRANGGSSR